MSVTNKFASVALSISFAVMASGCVSGDKNPPPPKPRKTPKVHLVGSIKASAYTSSEGGFSVPVPVSPEVGGRVLRDGPQTVTFTDNWGSRISFTSQPILPTSTMMQMVESQGREKALTEFAHREYGDMIEPHYHSDVREGMLTFIYLRPAAPKMGVAVFVHNYRLFLVESDMLPGVSVLGQNDLASDGDRDLWLEGVAMRLAQSITAN